MRAHPDNGTPTEKSSHGRMAGSRPSGGETYLEFCSGNQDDPGAGRKERSVPSQMHLTGSFSHFSVAQKRPRDAGAAKPDCRVTHRGSIGTNGAFRVKRRGHVAVQRIAAILRVTTWQTSTCTRVLPRI